ncbi:MAG TPA: glycosyltransferase family 2 protein [Candidatus Saccharimonadales bacterium]|nr:glycosyltransferase family 2 protein [Candidatus Saccharimonadales bacterium]
MSRLQRISIIIPAYNEERYLARCLDAIAVQTMRPWEVLVVDNNSSDATAAIARQYPFVKLLREKRQGRAYAQRTGFSAAMGTVLARIDADAVLPPDWTAHVGGYFDGPGAMQTAWTSGALFYNVRFPRLVSRVYGWIGFGVNKFLAGHPSLWGSSMAIPAELWRAVSSNVCLRSDIHEDLDLSIHLYTHGYAIVPDPHTRVGVELRPAYANPRTVWRYLQLWPRTLRIHRKWTWILCWPINIAVFIGMPFFGISERIARLFGRARLGG